MLLAMRSIYVVSRCVLYVHCGVYSDRGQRCKSRPLWPTLIGHRVPRGQPTANGKIRSSMINITLWWPCAFIQFVLFFKDCDSSSGITNLRHPYGTISIRLKMNTFSFKKIDGLPAKFLGHNISRA